MTRDYAKKGNEPRMKPFIDATLAELNDVMKDDEFDLLEECDLPKVAGEYLKMVSLAKRIDRDLACRHTVQLGFPIFSFRLRHGTLAYT